MQLITESIFINVRHESIRLKINSVTHSSYLMNVSLPHVGRLSKLSESVKSITIINHCLMNKAFKVGRSPKEGSRASLRPSASLSYQCNCLYNGHGGTQWLSLSERHEKEINEQEVIWCITNERTESSAESYRQKPNEPVQLRRHF